MPFYIGVVPSPVSQRQAIRRAGIVVLGGNLLLVVIKAVAWSLSGSLAVGSETVNSAADLAYSLIVVSGLYLTTRPPDSTHPHGHERIEPFVSLAVAIGMLAAAVGLLYRSVSVILAGTATPPTGITASLVLVVAIGVKYGMYRYCLQIGRQHGSPAVRATALDDRNDIFAGIAALLGVVGAQAGYPVLDPLAAGLVAVLIGHTGITIGRRNVEYLVGKAPPQDLRERIIDRALEHPAVEGVHDVVAHYVGPEVDVALHIELPADRTLREAHDIETAIIRSIKEIDEVDDVYVHIDPPEEWVNEDPPDSGS